MAAVSVTAVRKPPVAAVFSLHLPREPGKCPWCGLEITERTPVRKQLKTIHSACSAELAVITSPEQARWYLFKRDHGICADCGEDWGEKYAYRPEHPEGHPWHISWTNGVGSSMPRGEGFPYVRIKAISLWHADHHIPLWKVRHLPDLQRLEYFKLANLKTRCDPCHERKSTRETADRAHFRELSGENKKKPKRDWPSRGFEKRPAFERRAPKQLEDL